MRPDTAPDNAAFFHPKDYFGSENRFTGNCGPVQVAWLGVIVTTRTVHGDTIVPHDQVPLLPLMRQYKIGLGGVFCQVTHKQPCLRYRPAAYRANVR